MYHHLQVRLSTPLEHLIFCLTFCGMEEQKLFSSALFPHVSSQTNVGWSSAALGWLCCALCWAQCCQMPAVGWAEDETLTFMGWVAKCLAASQRRVLTLPALITTSFDTEDFPWSLWLWKQSSWLYYHELLMPDKSLQNTGDFKCAALLKKPITDSSHHSQVFFITLTFQAALTLSELFSCSSYMVQSDDSVNLASQCSVHWQLYLWEYTKDKPAPLQKMNVTNAIFFFH